MNLYGLASNCVHYVGTMSRPFISGFNWTDIATIANMANVNIDWLLLRRLRKIESLVIKESMENVSD